MQPAIFSILILTLQSCNSDTVTLVLGISGAFYHPELSLHKIRSNESYLWLWRNSWKEPKRKWLADLPKKTNSHQLAIAIKAKQSLPKSKNSEEIIKEKKWEYQRTEVTDNSMIKKVKMKNRDYHEGDWALRLLKGHSRNTVSCWIHIKFTRIACGEKTVTVKGNRGTSFVMFCF